MKTNGTDVKWFQHLFSWFQILCLTNCAKISLYICSYTVLSSIITLLTNVLLLWEPEFPGCCFLENIHLVSLVFLQVQSLPVRDQEAEDLVASASLSELLLQPATRARRRGRVQKLSSASTAACCRQKKNKTEKDLSWGLPPKERFIPPSASLSPPQPPA